VMGVSACVMTAEHGRFCCCVAENSFFPPYRSSLHECTTHTTVACRAVRGVALLCIGIACCLSDAVRHMHRQQQSTLSAALLRCCTVISQSPAAQQAHEQPIRGLEGCMH